MKLLLTIALLLAALGRSYGQCPGLIKRFVASKQKTLFYSPGYNGPAYAPVSFMRSDRSQRTDIYLTLRVKGDSAASQHGSTVLFSDGSALAWPARVVGFKTTNGLPLWIGFNPLTGPEMTNLSTKLITTVKVYRYEQSLTKAEAEQVRESFKCVREAK